MSEVERLRAENRLLAAENFYMHIIRYNNMQKERCDMRKFDYSFLHDGLLPANLVNLTSNISALKTMAGVRKMVQKQTWITARYYMYKK